MSCFLFFYYKRALLCLNFVLFLMVLIKNSWGIESSLFHWNQCNSYFKIFTQCQNTKMYEYFRAHYIYIYTRIIYKVIFSVDILFYQHTCSDTCVKMFPLVFLLEIPNRLPARISEEDFNCWSGHLKVIL